MTHDPHEPDRRPAFGRELDGFAWAERAQEEGSDAEVVPLDSRRRARQGDEPTDPDDDYFDRETIAAEEKVIGPPADPPDEDAVPVTTRTARRRAPIIPAWLRTWQSVRAMVTWQARDAAYVLGYHAVRSPKYLAKALWYAIPGVFVSIGRLLHWATAEEGNWALRQYAADRNDAETWLKLDKQRQRQSRWRWSVLMALSMVALAGLLAFLVADIPGWMRLGVLALAVRSLPPRCGHLEYRMMEIRRQGVPRGDEVVSAGVQGGRRRVVPVRSGSDVGLGGRGPGDQPGDAA